jgi:hypothetical protein
LSKIGTIVKGTIDLLTPDDRGDRITFNKFDGRALAAASELGTDVPADKITTIILKVNPEEISYSRPKITQKVQTSAPARFVVFDWGTDLLTINISGNTGNMLPGIVKSGFDPMTGFVRDIAQKIDPYQASQAFAGKLNPYSDEMNAIAQKIMLESLSYDELLDMSPKYKTFLKLQNLYDIFDADMDVLTMEMGDVIYRGYFFDFSFTQTAMNPWNWKYNIVFMALDNLGVFERRNDDALPAVDGTRIADE